MRLHADRIQHGVRPASVGERAQQVEHVIREAESLNPVPFRHLAALLDRVDRDHAVPEVPADAGRELADGPETDHREGAAIRNIRVLHTLPGRRQDVAEKQVALVGQVGVDLHRVEVGVLHPHKLGLPTGDATVDLGVAVERRAGLLVAVLGGLALRGQAARAHVAKATRDDERNDDTVARPQLLHGGTHFGDDAHGFVAHHVVAMHERAEHIEQVQV